MRYRIGMLSVPEAARAAFERQSAQALEFLRAQPGFIDAQILDKVSGAGTVDIITIIRWDSDASVAAAGKAMATFNEALGIDIGTFRQTNGIVSSDGVYAAR